MGQTRGQIVLSCKFSVAHLQLQIVPSVRIIADVFAVHSVPSCFRLTVTEPTYCKLSVEQHQMNGSHLDGFPIFESYLTVQMVKYPVPVQIHQLPLSSPSVDGCLGRQLQHSRRYGRDGRPAGQVWLAPWRERNISVQSNVQATDDHNTTYA